MEIPLGKIQLLGSLFFNSIKQINTKYIINKIANKFSLAGDKFMPEMYVRQPGFMHSACGPLTKYKNWIQKFKETDSRYSYPNELDKAFFKMTWLMEILKIWQEKQLVI